MTCATLYHKRKSAGLGTLTTVAASASQYSTEVALSRHAHTQRAVDEYLELGAASGAGAKLLPGHLPREHHTGKAERGERPYSGGGVAG